MKTYSAALNRWLRTATTAARTATHTAAQIWLPTIPKNKTKAKAPAARPGAGPAAPRPSAAAPPTPPPAAKPPRASQGSISTYPTGALSLALPGLGTVAYTDEGSGPALLFLHGMDSSLAVWRRTVPSLASHYRCLALDLPGYGRSPRPQSPLSLPGWARVVQAFVAEMKLGSVAVVGHSMGGQLAIFLALDQPLWLRALALVNPAGLETFSLAQAGLIRAAAQPAWLARATEGTIRQSVSAGFYQPGPEAEGMLKEKLALRRSPTRLAERSQALAETVKAMLAAPVADRLPSLALPVLLVMGQEDKLVPNRALHPRLTPTLLAQQAARRISGSQLVLVPQAGHYAMLDQPAAVHSALESFLLKLPSP